MDQAEVQRAIDGANFPASRDHLVEQARRNEADDEVVSVLEQLPALTFASPTEVSSQLTARS